MTGVLYNVISRAGRDAFPRAGRVAAAAAAALLVSFGVVGTAQADVTSACSRDYKRYCKAYSIGTPELRRCMESNRRSLSRRCVRALVDSGQVPRKYARRR